MAAGDSCMNCKFVGQRQQQTPQGQVTMLMCRRHPPKVHAQFFVTQTPEGHHGMQDATNTYWPVVQQTDWCGEHTVDIQLAGQMPQNLRRS